MSQYSYKAVNRAGERVSGVVEAADRRSAVAGLADNGQFVIEVAEQTEKTASGVKAEQFSDLAGFFRLRSGRITGKDILALTSQLSAALRAGLPLLGALETFLRRPSPCAS